MVRDPGRRVKLRLDGGLPFVTVEVGWEKSSLTLDSVLLDTGSAIVCQESVGTPFSHPGVWDSGTLPSWNQIPFCSE